MPLTMVIKIITLNYNLIEKLLILLDDEVMMDLLIKNGADVNFRDYMGKTALHYASELGNL